MLKIIIFFFSKIFQLLFKYRFRLRKIELFCKYNWERNIIETTVLKLYTDLLGIVFTLFKFYGGDRNIEANSLDKSFFYAERFSKSWNPRKSKSVLHVVCTSVYIILLKKLSQHLLMVRVACQMRILQALSSPNPFTGSVSIRGLGIVSWLRIMVPHYSELKMD